MAKILFLLVIAVLSCLILVTQSRLTVHHWRSAIEAHGTPASLQIAWLMARLRWRQPLREMMLTAPGLSWIPYAGLGAIVIWEAIDTAPTLLAVGLALPLFLFAAVWSLVGIIPPTVILVGASDAAQFQLLATLKRAAPGGVITLINHRAPGPIQAYQSVYRELDREIHPKGLDRITFATMRPFANPSGPRVEVIRTRPAYEWQPVVQTLLRHVPLIVVDTRASTNFVDQEIQWILSSDLVDKTMFVVDGKGQGPALDRMLQVWPVEARRLRRVFEGAVRDEVYKEVRRIVEERRG